VRLRVSRLVPGFRGTLNRSFSGVTSRLMGRKAISSGWDCGEQCDLKRFVVVVLVVAVNISILKVGCAHAFH
jgi:hypothetical protein